MKVYGQLEVAQLEQIAATTTTPTPTGRIYCDITNPVSAVPRFYNGTSWMGLQMTTPSTPYSQNSGTAVTVNWANGLIQQVVLTGNCVISFSNPVPGQTHKLYIVQSATSAAGNLPFVYTFNMPDQDCRRGTYQPAGQILSGQNRVYEWLYSPGIKAGYATIPAIVSAPNSALSAPPTGGVCTNVDISPLGDAIAVGSNASSYLGVFSVYDTPIKPQLSPFQSIAGPTGQVTGICYAPNGSTCFVATYTSPYISAYGTNAGFQQGTSPGMINLYPWANPATLPAGIALSMTVHPLSCFIAVGHAGSPYMSVYPANGQDGFGARLGAPATPPANSLCAIAFSPTGDYIAGASQVSPYIQCWQFNVAAGLASASFGTASANPATLPPSGPQTTAGKQIAWHPSGNFIALITQTSPYLYVIPFNRATGAFGTPLNIGYTPAGQLNAVQFTPDGQYLVLGAQAAPWLIVLDFSSQTIGSTAVAFDGTGIGQIIFDIAIAKHGEWVACSLEATPYFKLISLPTKVRNYSKFNF